jgi:hypothetical protein
LRLSGRDGSTGGFVVDPEDAVVGETGVVEVLGGADMAVEVVAPLAGGADKAEPTTKSLVSGVIRTK